MAETKMTPIRLTEDERSLAEQIGEDAGTPGIAAGVRLALHAEAKRRKLKPRTAEKKGVEKG